MSRGRAPEPQRREKIRCAIYTRKSTEEGLDQAFNSLDAQREACAAYIMSQRHEGWTQVPDYYDDGGYTGGNMERPGLKQLLADVKAGKVNVIVVYKVDRLTRALSDFAKIVDVLDAAGASFVSITQSFNTTTSMGRLTLNVLLSFAQFEREVISERVRDKVAASKRKGMWMGGQPPLGYDVKDRKLIINEPEAETIRFIMRRYLELGSVHDLALELRRKGIVSKIHYGQDGQTRGGNTMWHGVVYHILQNQIYRGVVAYKGEIYPGEHEAIVPEELWDAVQQQIASNRREHKHKSNAIDVSLLAGMIRDGEGRRMTPSHSQRKTVRWRYYNSIDEGEGPHARPIRIHAADIESAVFSSISRLLKDESELITMFGQTQDGPDTADLLRAARNLDQRISTMVPSEQRALLLDLSMRIAVHPDRVEASIDPAQLGGCLGLMNLHSTDDRTELEIPTIMVRRGSDVKLMIQPDASAAPSRKDPRLVELIAKAFEAKRLLGLDGKPPTVADDLEYQERNHLARLARLSFLAPDILRAILEGLHPVALGTRKLMRVAELPMDWDQQRRALGFT